MSHTFHIAPRSTGISVTLGFLVVLAVVIGVSMRDASGWVFVPFLFLMLGMFAVFSFFLYSSRCTTFALSEEGFVVNRTMYGRSVPVSDLKTEDARAVDLTQDTAYRGKWRTNGLGLPDYSLGWFILRNKEKALMFVTDQHNVVHIPTRAGFSILLSTPTPEAFLQALREISSTGDKTAEPEN